MMNNEIKIIFKGGYTELDEIQMPLKGYRNDVEVHFSNGMKFNYCFYDAIRLSQDIIDEKYIIEENLIVLDEVTKKKIELVINKLWTSGLYKKYKPIGD